MTQKEFSQTVSSLFDNLAKTYDTGNLIISLGQMPIWRNATLTILRELRPKRVLDLATGTADLACAMAKEVPSIQHIIGADISSGMLKVAQKKIDKKRLSEDITLVEADAMSLPFADNTFDTLTCAFGIRNFPSISKGLSEMNRVLMPNGNLVILELSEPKNKILRKGHHIYTRTFLKFLGNIASFDGDDCNYLQRSIEKMPQYDNFVELMYSTGFENITYRPLSFGIATIFTANKRG